MSELVEKDAKSSPQSQGRSDVAPPRNPPAAPSGSEIPDGGFNAYLQVFGAHLLFFNSWGIINTFGAYQEYYETSMLAHKTPSAISWIGTLQGFLLFLVGIITGPVFDRGYCRALIIVGTFLVFFGMMITSVAKSYPQLIFAQGICVGLGSGCLFLPSIAIVATYFTSKRALMTGITAAGGSIVIGGAIFPIVFRRLEPSIGFGWATRIIGLIALGTLCISIAVMRTRTPPPKQARALLDLTAFRDTPFNLLCVCLFVSLAGLYIPFFYSPIYGQRISGLPNDVSFYLLVVLNVGSIFGRILPGLIAGYVGPLNAIIPCAIISTILAFSWLAITGPGGLWAFAAMYGIFSGAIVSLPPGIVALITPDMRLLGTRMGMCFAFAGFGLLIGNPIAGALLNVPRGDFHGAQIFCATTLAIGAVLFIVIRWLLFRAGKGWKA